VPLPGAYETEVTGWLPSLALVNADGSGLLVLPEDELAGARAASWLEPRVFDALRHFAPSRPLETWMAALRAALDAAGLSGSRARVGIEPSLPHVALGVLAHACPDGATEDVSAALARARSIKTPRELERLRAAIRLADLAQRRLVELAPAAPGSSDVELWGELVAAIQSGAGRAVTVTGALVTGSATSALAAGGPVGRRIDRGDPGLLDIGPRLDGYWADCANTVVFGAGPDIVQRRYLSGARLACEAAIDRLRPGLRCAEPALALRSALERVGLSMAHYAGHQVGTGINETPRLLPFAEERIEAGMVFAVEAGAYGGDAAPVGARCEKIALVTESGPELLSGFEWE
jgi:Xaa-Pro aminopeptidase